MKLLKRFFKEEDAQAMTEYILVIALVAVAAITAFIFFRDKLIAKIKELASTIFNAK